MLTPRLPAPPVDAGRRDHLERMAAISALGISAIWGLAMRPAHAQTAISTAPVSVHEQRPLMGTLVDITLEGADSARLAQALEVAYRDMTRLSDMMNHYSPDSVVSAVNLAAGVAPVPIPPELMRVLRMAQHVSERSQGAFDITVASIRGWRFSNERRSMPTPDEITRQLPLVNHRDLVLDTRQGTAFLKRQGQRIDLGGIAKIYILDAGMHSLKQQGVRNAMINGGGDVLVMSDREHRPWKVGVRDPRAPEKLMGVLSLRNGIVASSGDYERYFEANGRRYHHILDPKTGYPTQGPHGVTLVSDSLERIDGLGAAIMVLGARAGRQLLQATPGLDGLIVDDQLGVWMSPGMRQRWGYQDASTSLKMEPLSGSRS